MISLTLQSVNRALKLACVLVAAILAAIGPRCACAQLSDSISVFHCGFDDDWDVDYDGWPDRWMRKSSVEFPHYVNIAIQDDDSAAGGRSVRIDLDGASASISSPPIRVISRFSYVLSAQLKCEGLHHSVATLSLDFCDASGRVMQSAKSDGYRITSGWQAVQIDAVEPRDAEIQYAVVSLQVIRGSRGDLQGRVCLADVRVERLPRIDVSTNNPCNVYTEPNGVEIECALSGIRERDPEISFQLLDASEHELQRERFRLDGQLIVDKSHRTGKSSEVDEPNGYEGKKKWQPKIPGYGFYRIVVGMTGSEKLPGGSEVEHQLGRRTVDLVVVPPLGVEMPRRGEFGWTLPTGDRPLSFQDLSRLLPQVGINWVKAPVWFDVNDPRRGDELIRFVELLGASNIDVVGIVDKPPGKLGDRARVPLEMTIADVLAQDPSTWSATLEPVMSRLALRVRWWQLGRDYDNSLINLPELNKRIGELRTALFRFGQDVRMGMCADWESDELYTGKVKWDFLQVGTDAPIAEKKYQELLAKPRVNTAQRWVLVDPPAPERFLAQASAANVASLGPPNWLGMGSVAYLPAWLRSGQEIPQKIATAREARATAFVHRLIAAKLSGADAIIVPRPFDDENGLMSADGMPAELLLPWRTTAAMLGGAQYIGRLQLPNGSDNCVFVRPDGQTVMVAWNSEPTQEILYLGNKVRQLDIMGCAKAAPLVNKEQVIEVGPTPTFVLGLNESIARWRMAVKFERTSIPSIYSKPHRNSLTFKNFFPQGVGGKVRIVVLQDQDGLGVNGRDSVGATGFAFDRWTIEPPQATFQLAADAEKNFPFDIKLKNALYGTQRIRIDFTVEADERLEFSAYGAMEVGTEDVKLDVRSHLDKDGTLIVEQFMTNRSGQLSDFKCHLRSKGHQPQRMQVYRLGRDVDRKVYRIADAADLVGKELLLEIEELNGQRLLNYRFIASERNKVTEKPDSENAAPAEDTEKADSTVAPRPLAKLGS